MKWRRLLPGALLAALIIFSSMAVLAQNRIEGTWQGTLTVPGAQLRIVFNIAKAPDGKLSATMDSPDQGATGIPVDTVSFTQGALVLELKALGGKYEGTLAPDSAIITGTWKQSGMSFPLTLRSAALTPSTPTPPAPEFRKSTSSDPTDIKGNWLGAINFSGVQLRLVVKLTVDSTGKLHSALDSPDQSVTDIPVEEVTFVSGHLRLASKTIGGSLEGDLAEDKSSIAAKWSQGGVSIAMQLNRTDSVFTFNRPQEPKPPFPYDEREVTYDNKEAGVTLAGTLTLPKEAGPFPAVLLITGSGAQDRNETLMGHKPFLVLSDYLTRRGVAVLRVDDRGVGKSTGSFKNATSLDFLSDVLTGVEYLKSLPEIDHKKIGLIGHSEGGLIAPMAAMKSPDVAFIVLMAGPGLPGDQVLLLQQELIARAEGQSEDMIARNREIQKQAMAVAKSGEDTATAAPKIRQIIKDGTAGMTDDQKKTLEYSSEMIELGVKQMLSPWFRYFMLYDPRPTLEKVKCPVLAINGEKDLQVPAKEDLSAIADALGKARNKDVTTKEMPGLNHLFQTANTGSPSEYGKIEETIAPAALAEIGDWIQAHVAKGK